MKILEKILNLILRKNKKVDHVMVDKQEELASNVPFIIVGFVIVQGIFIYTSTLVNSYVAGKITYDLKRRLYIKLLKMDCGFFDKNDSGMVIFRFYNDAEMATNGLINNFKLFLTKFLSTLSLVCVLIYNSWQLSCAAIGVLLFLIIPLRIVRKRINIIMKKTVMEGAFILTLYNETSAGNRIIRSFTLEDTMMSKFKYSAKFLFGMGMKMVRDTNWLSPMMHVVSAIGVAIVIWYGGHLIVTQQITSGTFVSFLAALIMLYTESTPHLNSKMFLSDIIQKKWFWKNSILKLQKVRKSLWLVTAEAERPLFAV